VRKLEEVVAARLNTPDNQTLIVEIQRLREANARLVHGVNHMAKQMADTLVYVGLAKAPKAEEPAAAPGADA